MRSKRMKGPINCCAALVIAALSAAVLRADTLVLKSGQTVIAKSFLRDGDSLVAAAGPGGDAVAAGTRVPLADITSVECDLPAVLKNAPAQLAAGKASGVLSEIRLALPAAEVYGEMAGSCWPDLISLQAHVTLATGSDAEAAELANAMKKLKHPGLIADSRALQALIAARKGDHSTAASLAEPLLKDSTARPSTVAAASVALGLGYLEKKKFTEALKAFLELPVFLPDETALSGIARLGAAQAYFGMEDYDRAIATLEELVKTQPEIPEASTAKSLLPEWTRRRHAVQEAKQP